jgi:hypothetical protein
LLEIRGTTAGPRTRGVSGFVHDAISVEFSSPPSTASRCLDLTWR